MHVRNLQGNIVTPMPLGVTLPDFTEWALPFLLVEDDGQDVGNPCGLVKVGHTREVAQWEGRPVQQLMHKLLQMKQLYLRGDKVGMTESLTSSFAGTRTAV